MVRRLPLLVALLVLLGLSLPGAPAGAADDGIVRREVGFEVRNVNRSKVPCDADGKTYTVRGSITAPRAALDDPGSVTLLLHGLSYGEFFSTYQEQAGYDFARKQAADGHVTVAIDRLGYDSSDRPNGLGICLGSQADMASQMVEQLRAGTYRMSGGSPAAFKRVVLAGHSVGALITQVASYSFDTPDGVALLSYSDTVVSPATKKALAIATKVCRAGGVKADGGSGPDGYAYLGKTDADFVAAHFFPANADPAVVDGTTALRNRDPCGDLLSYETAVGVNLRLARTIDVPALVLIGAKDAIYPTPAATQARRLTGSPSVTSVTLPNVAHALTLHDNRNVFHKQFSSWLDSQGF